MMVRAFAVAVVLAMGCGGESSKLEQDSDDDDKGGSSNGGTNSGGSSRGGTNATSGTSGSGADGSGGMGARIIYLYDENNYRSLISLSIPTVETASGMDLEICWTDVMTDLDCAEVNPQDDIGGISMLRLRSSSEEQIEEALAQGELRQETLDGLIQYESAHDSTCTQGSSFANFDMPIDFAQEYAVNDDLLYVFMFTRGTTPGAGVVTMMFARPVVSSMNTLLNAQPGCNLRSLATDLSEPVRVPFEGPWIVDWGNITQDGQGNRFNAGNIDTVTVWFVAGVTIPEVENRISELDALATESYRLETNGQSSVILTDLASPTDGRAFSGFGRPNLGVWLFGLSCSTCLNAGVPLVLTVFELVETL